jgi:hypothetical protein
MRTREEMRKGEARGKCRADESVARLENAQQGAQQERNRRGEAKCGGEDEAGPTE